MTRTITIFDAATTAEMAARARQNLRASAFVLALSACLGSPALSSSAAAAPFQQYANASCGGGDCFIFFPVTPTGKRLEIYDVSCYLRMNGANVLEVMGLIVGVGAEHLVVLAPEVVAGGGASESTVYAANHSIFAYAREGERFGAFVERDKGVVEQFACHISGEMLDARG